MQQALDALIHNYPTEYRQDAVTVLRAELAKPEPEPVAWAIVSNSTGEYYGVDLLVESCDSLVSHSGIDGYRNASVVPLYRKEDV
jgi:hypothetical protein